VTTETVPDPVSEVAVKEPTGKDPVLDGDASALTIANTELEPEPTEGSEDVDVMTEAEKEVLPVPAAEMADLQGPETTEVSL
jgi:hypothetical protein